MTKSYPYSETRPFKSIYKAGYITPANYIAELIFKKRSESLNYGSNAQQFWLSNSPLHGSYKGEVIAANKLLKKYHADCIIKAIQSPKAKYIMKLAKKENIDKLVPIIESFEKERTEKELVISEKIECKGIQAPFTKTKNKNVLKGL